MYLTIQRDPGTKTELLHSHFLLISSVNICPCHLAVLAQPCVRYQSETPCVAAWWSGASRCFCCIKYRHRERQTAWSSSGQHLYAPPLQMELLGQKACIVKAFGTMLSNFSAGSVYLLPSGSWGFDHLLPDGTSSPSWGNKWNGARGQAVLSSVRWIWP